MININDDFLKNNKITFRPLVKNDLQLMVEWLKKAHVHEWFASHKEITEAFVDYVFINGDKFIQRWIFQINGEDIGYIQNYFYEDDKDISERYINEIGAKSGSATLDFFIGDEEYVHKGYGKFIVKQFIKEKIFSDARCKNIIVGPRTKNLASIKTLEANGFRWFKNVIDDKCRDEYMMVLEIEN